MMNLKISSNFSWTKLLKFFMQNEEFGQVINKYITEPIVEDSKEAIRSNKVTPATLPITLKMRKARKSPKSISNSTLYDTGKLHDSIKMSDIGGFEGFGYQSFLKGLKNIEMVKYGKYHQFGDDRNKKREFINLSTKNADIASKELMKRMVRSWKKRLPK